MSDDTPLETARTSKKIIRLTVAEGAIVLIFILSTYGSAAAVYFGLKGDADLFKVEVRYRFEKLESWFSNRPITVRPADPSDPRVGP